MSKNILITGGAGFIGSNLVQHMVKKYPDYQIYNLDNLTYAGNLTNLKSVEKASNYHFLHVDIRQFEEVVKVIEQNKITHIIHLAAESHVDRSITNPFEFAETNVMGTLNLLEAAKRYWNGEYQNRLFYHVSTDEVYGALSMDNSLFTENTAYDPRSPYSASKASSDHFVNAYYHTYGLPIVMSNCSNNYGPYQFPEKLLPLMINNIRHHKPLPIYGKGENVRDWLFVLDHVEAIDLIMHNGKLGESYNVGGNNEWHNIDIVKKLIQLTDEMLGNTEGYSLDLITFVEDRKGHDLRYAIDSKKIQTELGWQPKVTFEQGLRKTVEWYLSNQDWLNAVTNKSYQDYYDKMYKNR